ncbi:uncharacterized protein BDR25DRAFT_341025 [Lindgomyces ingoldianus]|uniref:Uncharacterized protein n=1 Tax=Lindgomyces ingoldianus TaxID=673940 RepID=A0ACB6R4N5_9PLEO|nr:uncharacterized protein BDR25DRAFT_341025 [Lindgomyces ingoldianus]KAF2473740.1 hypothetical protein BDR25DRAFT_341025 [Lindgomyces ingoldianus]
MEGWKFVNYSSLSPLVALSLTTERWGLEPLPGNLRASYGYLDDLRGRNDTSLSAWKFSYGCATTKNDLIYEIGGYSVASNYSTVSVSDQFCSKPQRCGQSTCINLIEGIGKTTAGPAKSNILKLSYGISALITILSGIIMGCFSSKVVEPDEQPRPVRPIDKVERTYNPPAKTQKSKDPYFVSAPPEADKAKEIAHCADLLRQMYSLDILIWTAEDNVGSERAEQARQMEKADALYNEIQRIVNGWRDVSLGYFSGDERKYVHEICTAMDKYGRRGYRGGVRR